MTKGKKKKKKQDRKKKKKADRHNDPENARLEGRGDPGS